MEESKRLDPNTMGIALAKLVPVLLVGDGRSMTGIAVGEIIPNVAVIYWMREGGKISDVALFDLDAPGPF